MHIKHSIVVAAVVTAAIPAGLLGVGAGASIAHSAVDPVAHAAKAPTVALRKTSLGKVLVAGASGRTLYLFSEDGKTTYQMAALHRNQLIKVYYDQKFLGQRHADRIEVLNRSQMEVKQQKG